MFQMVILIGILGILMGANKILHYGVPREVIVEYSDPWDKRHSGHGNMKSHIKKQVRRTYKKRHRRKMN
jgi:hypothetical protein